VQDGRNSQDLCVVRSLIELRERHGKEPGAHDMIEEVRFRLLARIFDGTGNQR